MPNQYSDTDYSDRDIERFAAKVAMPADDEHLKTDCWQWLGAQHGQGRGYGKFRLDGRMMPAHRAAYLLFNGPIPPGYVVNHKCNCESCTNPYHLEAVTQQRNVEYCVECGRRRNR